MSIQIGSGTTSTSRERIVLASDAQSNMILMKTSTLQDINIIFDPDGSNMTFGKSGSTFGMLKNTSPIATFNLDSSRFSGSIYSDQNAFVRSNITSMSLNTSNITINTSNTTDSTTTYLLVKRNGEEILSGNADGRVTITGDLTVVNGSVNTTSMYVASDIAAPRLFTNTITPYDLDSSIVELQASLRIASNLTVDGDFAITNINFDTVAVTSNIQSAIISLSNVYKLPVPQLSIIHNRFSSSDSNVVDIQVASNTSNTKAFSIDAYGRTMVGASVPKGVLTVGNPSGVTSNTMVVVGSNQNVYFNPSGNVGVGTDKPRHRMTVYDMNSTYTNALLGLYSSNAQNNFIEGFSDGSAVPVFSIGYDGTMTLPYFTCDTLTAKTVQGLYDTPISFASSTLTEINSISATNVSIDNTVSTSNLVTSNLNILGSFNLAGVDNSFPSSITFKHNAVNFAADAGSTTGAFINTGTMTLATTGAYLKLQPTSTSSVSSKIAIDSAGNILYLFNGSGSLADELANSGFRLYYSITPADNNKIHLGNMMSIRNGIVRINVGDASYSSFYTYPSDAGYRLIVNGGFKVYNVAGQLTPGAMPILDVLSDGITANQIIYANNGVASMSDERIKRDITRIEAPMEKISKLSGYTYYRTDIQVDAEAVPKRECGLIAQEVLKVLPEVVEKSPNDMYTIAYGNLAGLFVEGFKEMQERIIALESRIKELENNIPTTYISTTYNSTTR